MGQVGIDLNLKPDPQQGLGFRVLVNVIWEQTRHLHLSDQMNVLEMMPELTAPAQLERPRQSFVTSADPKLKAQTLNSTAQNLRVLYCTEPWEKQTSFRGLPSAAETASTDVPETADSRHAPRVQDLL